MCHVSETSCDIYWWSFNLPPWNREDHQSNIESTDVDLFDSLEREKGIIYFAQVTDFHLDPYFTSEGTANSQCHNFTQKDPSLLRKSHNRSRVISGKYFETLSLGQSNMEEENVRTKQSPDTSKFLRGAFGYLGSYCDSPPRLVDLVTSFIEKRSKVIDYVIWSGDSAR
jgi:hypothetical protein